MHHHTNTNVYLRAVFIYHRAGAGVPVVDPFMPVLQGGSSQRTDATVCFFAVEKTRGSREGDRGFRCLKFSRT